MRDRERPTPDYLFDHRASMELLDDLRYYYNRRFSESVGYKVPKFWLERKIVPYGESKRVMYSVRSSIIMRIPE